MLVLRQKKTMSYWLKVGQILLVLVNELIGRPVKWDFIIIGRIWNFSWSHWIWAAPGWTPVDLMPSSRQVLIERIFFRDAVICWVALSQRTKACWERVEPCPIFLFECFLSLILVWEQYCLLFTSRHQKQHMIQQTFGIPEWRHWNIQIRRYNFISKYK